MSSVGAGVGAPGKRTVSSGFVARKASGAGEALAAGPRGRLESALGADLSSVRVHTGAASAAAAEELHANAFAVGQDIHFASGKYDPGSPEGDRLLAHEVAHTVQQRGVAAAPQCQLDVSSPSDPLEHEADAFADAFVGGGTAPVSRGGAPDAVVHRFSIGDAASVFAGPLAGRAIDSLVEQIEEAGGVVAALEAAVGPSAFQIIDWAAAHQVDALLDFFAGHTGHPGLAYALRRISLEDVTGLLARLSPADVMQVATSMISGGQLRRFADAMWELGKEQLRIVVRALPPSWAKPLFQHARDKANQFAREVLQEIWPVGFGIEVEASVGAAFGIPLKIDLSGQLIATRRDEQIVEFYRRGEGFIGAYAGASLGGYAGLTDGKPGSGGMGVGAQVGVEAQAGLTGIITQRFDFPIFQDDGFLTMLVAATGLDTAVVLGGLFSESLRSIDPYRYHRSTKIEAKAGGQITGGLEAGAKAGPGEGMQSGSSKDGGPDTGKDLQWWNPAKLLRMHAFAGVKAWAGVGVEFENTSMHPDPKTGEVAPEESKVILSAEVGVALNLNIPVISQIMAALPSLDGAFGIKLTFRYGKPSDPEQEPPLLGVTHSLYTKNGDLDTPDQARSASETELAFVGGDPRDALDVAKQTERFQSWDKFLDSVQAMTLQRRVGVSVLGGKIGRTLMKQKDLSSMLKGRYGEKGVRLEGYLHFLLELDAGQVRTLFEAIRKFLGEAADKSLVKVFQEVVMFFATGTAPAYVKEAFEQLSTTLGASIKNVRAHVQIGANIAAGAKFATFRGHLSAGALLTYDEDVTELARDKLDDVYRFIVEPQTAGQALDVTPDELGVAAP